MCQRTKVSIEGVDGEFFGLVNNLTKIPTGFGVFKAGDWILCGNFSNGIFNDGQIISVNRK